MPHELEAAWHTYSPNQPPHLLPGDEHLQSRSGATVCIFQTLADYTASEAFADPHDASLHLGLIPIPFIGPLISARVFILMLNPGLQPEDYFGEAESQSYREALITNLRGRLDFFCLNPAFAWHSGFRYWHGKFRGIVAQLASGWKVPYLEALKRTAQRIVAVQLVPYHSAHFKLSDETLDSLQSVRLIRSYVRDGIVPRAQRGEVLIIVTRQRRYWGLPADEHIVVYDRQEARAAHLTPRSRGGARILEYLRAGDDIGTTAS